MTRNPERGRLPRILFLVFIGIGLWAAAYLAFLHVKVHTDPAYRSFCEISAEVSCEGVAQSRWAVFLGLPVATWGVIGYGLMGLLALSGFGKKRPHPAWPAGFLFALSAFALVGAIVLSYLSKAQIGAWCIVCMVSWGASLGTFLAASWELRRHGLSAGEAIGRDVRALAVDRRLAAIVLGWTGAVLVGIWIAYPRYWVRPVQVGPEGLPTGETAEGSPWIGAVDPELTVVSFSDYECPHCAIENFEVRPLLRKFPEVRLVFRHFPLDQACNPAIAGPFHKQACRIALATLCASDQGKFWEMSDLAFQHTGQEDPFDVPTAAKKAGVDFEQLRTCMASTAAQARLRADVNEGIKKGIRGTPSFFVDGKKLPGALDEGAIRRLLGKP